MLMHVHEVRCAFGCLWVFLPWLKRCYDHVDDAMNITTCHPLFLTI